MNFVRISLGISAAQPTFAAGLGCMAVAALCLVLAAPTPAAAGRDGGREVYKYLWLDSTPPGAEVEVDGAHKGFTPIMIRDVAEGRYTVLIKHRGYQPLPRQLTVPNNGERQHFALRQKNGTCRLLTEPSSASVWHGKQLLGRTPLVLEGLEPGEYAIKFGKTGFETLQLTVRVDADRPTATPLLKLLPSTGSINVVTLPTGASVFVSEKFKGRTTAESEGSQTSRPLILTGFRPGHYTVYMQYKGFKSAPKAANIDKGGTAKIYLTLWFPDIKVVTVAGNTYLGMLVEKSEAGDIVLAMANTQHKRIMKKDIRRAVELSDAESKELIRKRGTRKKD